eukprot:CAMPEP_0172585418 /NCGR_PEP_ID=MMETSP1068-20121228/4836_1 /TAXON_ID=35684 /ORGANISM="Pseudopedinella elastica, Strain CCMP716" /LENGTH=577 /DNA_ID=CAMNT_0013379865 /DNA_START=74 /DNA_END=1803 /DNA_ORIENTATION=+
MASHSPPLDLSLLLQQKQAALKDAFSVLDLGLIDSLTRECASLESKIASAPPPQTTTPEDPPENAVHSEGLDFVLSDLNKKRDTHLAESSAKATSLKEALGAANESLLLKNQQKKPYTEELFLARNRDSDLKSFLLISSETEKSLQSSIDTATRLKSEVEFANKAQKEFFLQHNRTITLARNLSNSINAPDTMDKIAASVAKVRTLKTQRMVALGNLDTKVTTFLQGISKLLTKGTKPKLKPLSSAWPESDLPNPTPNNRPTAPPTPPPDQSQSIKSIRDDSLSPLASHAPTSPSTALSPSPGSWYTQVPPLSLPPTIHEARPTDHDIIMDTLDGHRQSLGHTPNVFQSTPGCTASITSMFVFRHPNDPHQQHPNLAADPSSFWTPSQKNFDNSVWAIFSATRGLSGLYSSWYGTVPGTHGNQATNQIRNLNKKFRCPLDAVLAILARIYGPCTGQMHLFTPFFEALGIPPTSIPADLSSYTGLFSSGKPNIFDRTGRVSCDKPHLTQYIPHSYTYTPPDGVSPDGTPVWINPHQSKGPGHKGPIPGKGAGKGKGPNPGKGQLTTRRGQGLAPSRIS